MTRAIDLFCGWGGFTIGAEAAGAEVVWAGDYWPLAVEAHEINHLDAFHVCEDLLGTDWSALPDFDLLLASPPCQGHSTAAQPRRRPYHDKLRATSWAVVECAEATAPLAIVVENVPAFLRWGQFALWVFNLEVAGYEVQILDLMASRHGVPQRRRRIFVVATRTDTAPDFRDLIATNGAELAFGPCVEWDAGKWRDIIGASAPVRKRITNGRIRCGDRFITQHVTNHPGVPLSDPIRTITTKDQWAVVDDDRYRPLTVRETARAMGFPDSYIWPPSSMRGHRIKGLGNAVCPPMATRVVERVLAEVTRI